MKTFGQLDKNTQLIVAIAAVGVALFAVEEISKGVNQGAENVGTGIGVGAAIALVAIPFLLL